jgi:uncharacterized membrane protein
MLPGMEIAQARSVDLPGNVANNIETIARLRDRAAHGMGVHQRMVEAVARRVGRPRTVYTLVGVVAVWVAYNELAPRLGWRVVDAPPFLWLQGAVALFAALTTTLVLVAQTRQREEQDQRAHLELQLNLLSEQKATKIVALLEELRRDLPDVRDRRDPVAEAMQQEIDPHAVHSAIQR